MSEVPAAGPWPASPGAGSGATYARARLRLGIACVGAFVILATALLALDAPASLLPEATSWAWTDPAWIVLLVAVYVAVSAPFDRLGGLVLPRRHGRRTVDGAYATAWARGVAVHGAVMVAVGMALLAAGRAGGAPAVLGAVVATMLAMLALQVPLAVAVGGVHRLGDRLDAPDHSFVGGVVGLPGRERVLLPAAWEGDTARVQAARREAVRRGGSRALGAVVAMAFTLAGVAVALTVGSVAVTSIAGLATLALWTTLWSFLGLLTLPTPSRQAVLAADRAAIRDGIDPADLARVVRRLDVDQEDEPRRGAVVEAVFHPVPSLERRLAALDPPGAAVRLRPWHAARMALLLSWAGLGLLPRAVHCNCGRPSLWVLFPGD